MTWRQVSEPALPTEMRTNGLGRSGWFIALAKLVSPNTVACSPASSNHGRHGIRSFQPGSSVYPLGPRWGRPINITPDLQVDAPYTTPPRINEWIPDPVGGDPDISGHFVIAQHPVGEAAIETWHWAA